MKRFTLILMILTFVFTVHAQDVIVLQNAKEIVSKVLEISENAIKYKRWDNPEGPTYTIAADKILFIKYANGTKDVFKNIPEEITAKQIQTGDSLNGSEVRPFIKDVKYHVFLTSGIYYGNCFGIDLSFILGVRIFDYGFVGFKTGLFFDGRSWGWANENVLVDYCSYYVYAYDLLFVPVQLDFRGYYPINRMIHPYVEFSPGIELNMLCPGYLSYTFQLGAGVDVKHFSFGLGYSQERAAKMFYLKFGVRIDDNLVKKSPATSRKIQKNER